MQNNADKTFANDPDLARLEYLATLLDNRFRIPGTNIRFGLDAIIGLVPYVGDLAGFLVSGFLMHIMIRRGAGPVLMLRMMGNFALDAIVGVIPLVGDLFDFGFKANRRNVELLKKYYTGGKTGPSAGWSLAILGFLFLVLFALMIWGIWELSAVLFNRIF